ncbi:AlwI family type II restriction endonuclease [Prevotella melaninogenica]|uniref:McrB family protein n=1 Tax=Prevotella melaninogenica TaxID=28132 RepID=UPI0028E29D03|nr:AlwI family type II restriction endonuclease [Prevotella melaninogenica]
MRISDIKKVEIASADNMDYVWYITKQNQSFADLCYMSHILEDWNNNEFENYESFFNRNKTKQEYGSLSENTPHRATINCVPAGLLTTNDPYDSDNLTPLYYSIKERCNANFANTQSYQDLINNQLQSFVLRVNNNNMNPLLFLLKILLQVGDATGEYKITINEFKLFVATTSLWKDYFKVTDSILRYREDSVYKNECDNARTQSVQDVRIQKFLANHEFIETEGKELVLQDQFVMRARKLVANFEINGTTTERSGLTYYVNGKDATLNKDVVSYLSVIRTKPFLLLAGISGTGKSRIVKEMAYASCPDEGDLREDRTSPGNYCLVEVKPNWNDSTELLGYETVLDGGNYHLTKFVKFLIKAMQHENVPFFVCLDEMNLAAVEQYFAEFLSILESRKDVDGTIKSEPLIPATIFEKYQQKLHKELFPTKDSSNTSTGAGCYTTDDGTAVYLHRTYAKLMEEGLRIPRNLIVVGTVNMDDTTYQFSRKVIDRAMTIEMNEVNLNDMFDIEKPDALSYREDVVDKDWFFAPFAQSNNALQQMNNDERELLAKKIKATIGQTDADGTTTPGSLEAILSKTPFRIAYRVVNELILHFYALRQENKKAEFEELYNKALDNILMMKVLPRIEGNEDLVKAPLAQLATWTEVAYPKANAKIVEMRERLERSHFTSFWP